MSLLDKVSSSISVNNKEKELKHNINENITNLIIKHEEEEKRRFEEGIKEERETVTNLSNGLVEVLKSIKEGDDPVEAACDYDADKMNNKLSVISDKLNGEVTNKDYFDVLNSLFELVSDFSEYYKYFYNNNFVFCHSYGKIFIFLNNVLPKDCNVMGINDDMKDVIQEKYPEMIKQMNVINDVFGSVYSKDSDYQKMSIQCVEKYFKKI